ncbi:hypothetical protein L204_100927 [Cryptococcus depauperatus]
MATSIFVPVAYISVLVIAMATFSRIYRHRRAVAKTSFQPWFASHPARDTYISLLSDEPAPPENLLKAALLTRAITDVQRIWRIKEDKLALTNLHTRGLVGDDTMARFAAAEKELEAEIMDVISEANSFRAGWGQFIFATATEMAQKNKTLDAIKKLHAIKGAEIKRMTRRAKYLDPQTLPSKAAEKNSESGATSDLSTKISERASAASSNANSPSPSKAGFGKKGKKK